jgi:23S rRNA pseudouridine1911/1915/1917 synthase
VSLPLVVRFEDAQFAVVEKPAGMHTAPLRAGERDTLLERVLAMYPEVAEVPGIKAVEPGLLHRLDRETSGLVVIARTLGAFAALRESFGRGAVRKEYLAACAKSADQQAMEGATGGLTDPGPAISIASRFAPYGSGRRMVRVVIEGERRKKLLRGATADSYSTEAEVVRPCVGALLLRARIGRGFRHQVRVHLSFLGYPILGDRLYGAPVPPGAADRMYLHASRLDLEHPITGERLTVESPLPEEFAALLG